MKISHRQKKIVIQAIADKRDQLRVVGQRLTLADVVNAVCELPEAKHSWWKFWRGDDA